MPTFDKLESLSSVRTKINDAITLVESLAANEVSSSFENPVETPSLVLSAGPKILAGSGSPNTRDVAPKGSLYLRTDGGGVTSRIYINTDGNTAWSHINTFS